MEAFLASFLVVFLAELGDKTQFIVMAFTAKYRWQSVFAGMTLGILVVHSLAARTMAAQYESWLMVLAGAVAGMVLADSLGILAGAFLHRKLPAKKMRYLSAGIFLFFGVVGLLQSAFQGVFA